MKLPFGQIPPGAFDSAFKRPTSQATGLPMGVEQMAKDPAAAHLRGTGLKPGVETQAKQALSLDQGPMPPMIVNGLARFTPPTAPENGRAGYTDAGATPMQFQTPAQSAAGPDPTIMNQALSQSSAAAKAPPPELLNFLPAPAAPFNPLGGMDARPLSERGGPMAYSAQGEGTTNPNAFRVGQNNSSRGERYLSRIARRGGPDAAYAATQLAQIEGQRKPAGPDPLKYLDAAQKEREYRAGRADKETDRATEAMKFRTQQQTTDARRVQDRQWALEDEQRKAAQDKAGQGFSLQPLDPNDPSKGSAIMRGDGTLFNLLPGQKPEAPPPVLDFQRLPGTADAVPMYGDKPLPGAGMYTEQPGWSVKGLDQFMPKQKAQTPPTEILSYLPDGTLEGRTVRGPLGTVPTQTVKNPEVKTPSRAAGQTKSGIKFSVK